ncbi:DUF4412 domain-containing protein [Anaeromyxobacter diazotrophicus]|uniref:DUF4412 domain-containing protein n=1 Tax=Anaeromyxobacter diazotrophicus TaxID=2590199 RepID=A0A7I9VNP5_9BACT|nr:DUF4412 domain-containing protein [Anaeromyxobacter diazotrophicus]GEJ58034.1 hypothetical protein AMYX_27750 [Anaeromyxobacter diazotrophicus]
MIRWNAAAAALALAAASPARAGLVVTMTDGDGRTSVTSIEGKKLRVEHPRQGEEAAHLTLFDGDAHHLVEVDPSSRTYRVMTEAQGQELSARLQKMLAQLPPEQRARAEAALAKRQATPAKQRDIRFEPLGGGEEVAGFACQRYRVLRDGRRDEEGCFIPWSARAATRDDLAAFLELGRFFEGFTAAASGGRSRPGAARWMGEELARAPGFPAVLEHLGADGKRTSVHRLVKLERTRVPADRFAIPEGYAEVQSPLLDDASPRRARRGR